MNQIYVSIVLSLLVGTGALTFHVKYGIRLAVLEELFKQKQAALEKFSTDQGGLDKRLTLVESAVAELKSIRDDLKSLVHDSVPRREMQARFDSLEALIQAQK